MSIHPFSLQSIFGCKKSHWQGYPQDEWWLPFNPRSHQLLLDTPGSLRCNQRLIGKKVIDISHLPSVLMHQVPRRPNSLHDPHVHEGIPPANKKASQLSCLMFIPPNHLQSSRPTKFREDPTKYYGTPRSLSPVGAQRFLKSPSGTHA